MTTATKDVSSRDTHFEHLQVSLELFYCGEHLSKVLVVDENDLISRSFDPDDWASVLNDGLTEEEQSTRRHTICNRLHVANLAIEVLNKQSESGDPVQSEDFLRMAIDSLKVLEEMAAMGSSLSAGK